MKLLGLFLALGASLVSAAPLTLEPSVGAYPSPVQVSGYARPSYYYPAYYPGYQYSYWPTYNYYGSPAYDYVYVNQLYPGYLGYPTLIGGQRPVHPVSTEKPILEVDDGIEKLDEKVEPSQESTPHPNDDDDTVTIDAV